MKKLLLFCLLIALSLNSWAIPFKKSVNEVRFGNGDGTVKTLTFDGTVDSVISFDGSDGSIGIAGSLVYENNVGPKQKDNGGTARDTINLGADDVLRLFDGDGDESIAISETSIVSMPNALSVGVSSPSAFRAHFDANGLTGGAPIVLIDSDDNLNSRASLQIRGSNGSNEIAFFGSNGSVGFGTVTPDSNAVSHMTSASGSGNTSKTLRVSHTDAGFEGGGGSGSGFDGGLLFIHAEGVGDSGSYDLIRARNSVGSRFVVEGDGSTCIGCDNPEDRLVIEKTNATNVETALRLSNNASGAGTGSSIDFHTLNAIFNKIIGLRNNAGSGGNIIFQTMDTGGSLQNAITIDDDQTLQFHAYGAGILETDASGNVSVGAGNPVLSAAGSMRGEWCRINNSGSPAFGGDTTNCSTWISSITTFGAGAGKVQLNFTAGRFTTEPVCICIAENNTDCGFDTNEGALISTSLVGVETYDSAGTSQNLDFMIFCGGKR